MHRTHPAVSGARRWDGTPRHARPPRSIRIAPTSPTGLLRAGQSCRCSACGNPVEWYDRTGHQPVSLHPRELPSAMVPSRCRWHVSSGIAYPATDGTSWCRVPHILLCPAHHDPATADHPHMAELRRHLALRTRRLLDAGRLTPSSTHPTPAPAPAACRPARPILCFLHSLHLAPCPLETIRCVAQTRRRHRCTHPVLDSTQPGTWTLRPTQAAAGQRALPGGFMAVYDLGTLPYSEQLRWHVQRCPNHAAAPAAADLLRPEWAAFDPLLDHQHIATLLPHTTDTCPDRH